MSGDSELAGRRGATSCPASKNGAAARTGDTLTHRRISPERGERLQMGKPTSASARKPWTTEGKSDDIR